MELKGYNSLTDMMRKAPINRETVEEYRNQALQVVDNAIDVFFKPEREVAEGKQAYDQLTDLERSLRAYQGRYQGEAEGLAETFNKTVHDARRSSSQQEVGATASVLPEGKPLKNGVRKLDYSDYHGPQVEKVSTERLQQLSDNMSSVLPLYGSVAMVPGPLAVSLKDHVKETLKWSIEASAYSESRVEQESFRLLTLSAGKKITTSGSASQTSASGKSETTTADERVMPGLHGIRNAVASLGFVPGTEADYKVTQDVTELEKTTTREGFIFKEDVVHYDRVNRGTLTVAEGHLPVYPGHIERGALRTNAGLAQARPGADLVDLVDQAQLTPEFVDTFRDKALEVLDSAVGTLFDTKREVANGREAYDKLTNLGRALSLAESKFGSQDRYNNPSRLPDQISTLAQVAPLYACVAMVPGEMSSSIKNHAKELYEASFLSQSGGGSRTHEVSGSLFGSLTETNGSSRQGAETSVHLRQENMTTDERIMPKLHDLKVQLDQMRIHHDRLVI